MESVTLRDSFDGVERIDLSLNSVVTEKHAATRVSQSHEELKHGEDGEKKKNVPAANEILMPVTEDSPVETLLADSKISVPPRPRPPSPSPSPSPSPASLSSSSPLPSTSPVPSLSASPILQSASVTVDSPTRPVPVKSAEEEEDEDEEEEERRGTGAFLGAGLRGFVQKRGMVPPVHFTYYTGGTRKKAFTEWLNAYVNGNLVSHAPTAYPHCQVYVNHDYKFIWIKGHKVGSTAMRTPLGWLCDDKWRVPKGSDFSHCSHAAWRNTTLTVKDMKRWWKEYFVFGIVRNPYTRFASAEEYIGGMIPQKCGRPTFEQTCREPYIHTRLCKVRGCCWSGATVHHYRHFTDQSTCLFTDTLLPAVDYIGELENLAEDFGEIIDEINRRRKSNLPKLVNNLKKRNAHGRRRLLGEAGYAYRLFKRHQVCLHTVSRFFNKDFELLDYEALDHLN